MARVGRAFPAKPFTSSRWMSIFRPQATTVQAGVASGVGVALALDTGKLARGVGEALTPSTAAQTNAAVSTASGTSPSASIALTVRAGLASGTGSAPAATATTIAPLGRFHSQVVNIDTTAMHWLAFGDSLTEGLNPSTSSAGFIEDRYVVRLLKLLQAEHMSGGTGGIGFVNILNNCANGSTAGTAYWTGPGPTYAALPIGGSADISDQRAFAHQTYNPAVNEVLVLHYTGTSFQLQYTLGSSPFTVAVDGGAPVTVTPGAGTFYQGSYSSPTLSHAAHIAVITPTSGQRARVHGAHIFDGDEGRGIRLWDNSQSALKALIESTYAPTDQLSTIFCLNPALVTICLGTNDFIAQNISAADFKTAIQQIITNVKNACTVTPSFLLIIPHEYGADDGATIPWSAYVSAYNAVAAEDPANVAVIDMSALMAKPTVANGYSGGKCNSDQIHLTSTGNQFWASSIDAALA